MEPWEVMISESQERMVAVVRPQLLGPVEEVLDRWELAHAVIGDVTDTGALRAFWEGEAVGEIPARLLTDECPRYEVEQVPRAATPERDVVGSPPPEEALVELLASSALRSREPFFRRYGQLVGSRTVRRPGSTPQCCGCVRRSAASPSPSTGRAVSPRSTRSRAVRSP
jgi:phosphoribosylformylglycinamidine synthase